VAIKCTLVAINCCQSIDFFPNQKVRAESRNGLGEELLGELEVVHNEAEVVLDEGWLPEALATEVAGFHEAHLTVAQASEEERGDNNQNLSSWLRRSSLAIMILAVIIAAAEHSDQLISRTLSSMFNVRYKIRISRYELHHSIISTSSLSIWYERP